MFGATEPEWQCKLQPRDSDNLENGFWTDKSSMMFMESYVGLES